MGKRHETIARIVSCARALFWENGYKKVTMQQIADKAEITKGLLTHYFPKKSDVLAASNYQYFANIYNKIEEYSKDEPLLRYMLTTYLLRKSQYTLPQLRRISEETFLSEKSENLAEYTTHDAVFIDIIRQFNVNISLNDLHPKLIMGMGAQKELTHVYLNKIIDMDLEEYLKNTIMVMCTVLEIPAIIRNQYYDKMMKIVSEIELPKFSYV